MPSRTRLSRGCFGRRRRLRRIKCTTCHRTRNDYATGGPIRRNAERGRLARLVLRLTARYTMSTHNIIPNTLVTAIVLSLSSIASAHNFPKAQTKADIAAERAEACRAVARPAKRTFARFGPRHVVKSGVEY